MNKAVNYSRRNKINKLFKHPLQAINKYMQLRLVNKFHKIKIIKGKLFFGQQMFLVIPEPVSVYLSGYGYFEEGLSNFILEYLNEGQVFIDIGSHFGYYTLLGSQIVGEKGEVHAFEPTPSTYEILKKNYKHCNMFINNLALSDKNQIKDFYDAGLKFSAFNSFYRPYLNDLKSHKENILLKKIQVKCTTLDEYFKGKERLPDFVKIDAEGAELQIFGGMNQIIKKKHPIITLEVGDHQGFKDNLSSQKVKYLINLGYQAFEYSNGEICRHVIKEKYGYSNLLFV